MLIFAAMTILWFATIYIGLHYEPMIFGVNLLLYIGITATCLNIVGSLTFIRLLFSKELLKQFIKQHIKNRDKMSPLWFDIIMELAIAYQFFQYDYIALGMLSLIAVALEAGFRYHLNKIIPDTIEEK